ncbi:MAG: fructose bisphosphate aldolase [Opitutales bacterium]
MTTHTRTETFSQQRQRMSTGQGFIAALDQSGGSTPKALREYGVPESEYSSEAEMFDRVHAMRTRLLSNPVFNADRILGAILFEQTMERSVDTLQTPTYLWEQKSIVPFLKVDRGMIDEQYGAQLMKEIHDLDEKLDKARAAGVFGTKMRSVIRRADADGIGGIVEQQFRFGRRICAAGLVPIIEPEVDIHAPDKAECEELLRKQLLRYLDDLSEDEEVMLKLTLPTEPDFYVPCQEHPRVLRVVALSGGYERDEANALLQQNHGLIASFSRALLEGLTAQQSEEQFTQTLDRSIESIYQASLT